MKWFTIILTMAMQSVALFSEPRHITVAADGWGEFTSVREEVNSIRAYMSDTT